MTGAASLTVPSPVGELTIKAHGDQITGLRWRGMGQDDTPVLRAAATQLAEYFTGKRRDFDLPLAPGGDPGLRRFLEALCDISYGETRTYGELARRLGIPAQVAGQYCGANPIPILIPCHRVLAAEGLGGYSGEGGIETKVALLKLEGAASMLI